MTAQDEIQRRVAELVTDAYRQGRVEGLTEGFKRLVKLSDTVGAFKPQHITTLKAEAEALRRMINDH
jgi:flagellar biosynthesis/type III secretory pathway protein FliH